MRFLLLNATHNYPILCSLGRSDTISGTEWAKAGDRMTQAPATITHDAKLQEIEQYLVQVRLRQEPEALSLEQVERRHIAAVLELLDGNKSAAARVLGVSRKTLQRKGY